MPCRILVLLVGLSLMLVVGRETSADEASFGEIGSFDAKVHDALVSVRSSGVISSALGVTRRETTIPALISPDDLDLGTSKTRVLLIGGLDGSAVSVDQTLAAFRWFHSAPEAVRYRERFAVSAVPIANPDAWATGKGPGNLSGGNPLKGYPPAGIAYRSPTDPEAAYLWRWIGMHAPDLVILLKSGDGGTWELPSRSDERLARLAEAIGARAVEAPAGELVSALATNSPSNTGTVPAIAVSVSDPSPFTLQSLLDAVQKADFTGPSPARKELQRRLLRTPIEVAQQLSRRYGRQLNAVAYIPALALVGRMRLGELTDDPSHLADVERIVAPYFNGMKPTLPKASGSIVSGHLVFGELARATGRSRYIALARAAADVGFDENGEPLEAMPNHLEMSDSVFMGCPILVQVGRLTGEHKYYDMALRHMRFMLKTNLRADGLHRHSPLDETAWGRGNGFPALGLALSLSDLPEDHPGRGEMLDAFRAHLAALVKHQDPTGAWHQIIDHPGSYREMTSTCMITFAMVRGVRSGWLDEAEYRPIIDKAWNAVLTRVAPDGTLVDVCTGTGKQKNRRAYFDRTAILGADDRGGAMALMVATERARLEAGK